MRLTLRTLLAYLDDILDPVQTKEIGARISENSVASGLVARIRDVTRRRRIGTPELSGPGSSPDPNVVAEYLDNTLDPAAVADVERVCLDSDVHLAEVAACHQILTIVLGEPVTIRPELRERMYAMGAVSPAPGTGTAISPPPYAVGSAPHAPARPVIPEYLKRPSPLRKLLPLAALLLVGAGWLYLVTSYGLFDNEQPEVAVDIPAQQADKPAAVKPPPPKPAQNAAVRPPQIGATSIEPEDIEPVVPAIEPGSDPGELTPETPAADPAVAAAVSSPMAPGARPSTEPPPAMTEAPEEAAPAIPAPSVMYTSEEGTLLYRSREQQSWTVLPRRALLKAGDEVASPEPFTGDLQISSPTDPAMTLRVSLQGGARIRLLPPTAQMLAELQIDRGRVAVYRPRDAVPHAIGLGITSAGLRTEFDAVTPETRYGLEVVLPRPQGGAPAEEAWPKPSGTLYVATGSVNVRRANLPPISGEETIQTLEWTNPSVEAFTSDSTTPIWLDPEIKPLPSQRNWARLFEAEFNLDLPVQDSIGPVAEQSKLNTIATYATMTAALIDDVPTLVRVLTSPHDEARRAAIDGLREWVMLAPEHVPRLEEEVSRSFRDQEAPVVTKLLWGVSDEEARDEAASMQVVEWLASDNIAIRELAFLEVYRLTLRDLGYRPQNTPGQREPALMRWRELVKRHKGLVPTVPEETPPEEPAP